MMKPFTPWQETIPILAGVPPRRTPRPGEQFDLPEPLCRESKIKVWLHAAITRLHHESGLFEECPGEGASYVAQTDV